MITKIAKNQIHKLKILKILYLAKKMVECFWIFYQECVRLFSIVDESIKFLTNIFGFEWYDF